MEQIQNPDNYNANQYYSNNVGFNSASALAIRLDTQTIVDHFEVYLTGQERRMILDPKTNEPKEIVITRGRPVVNEDGHQAVMRWINLIINAQILQGNFLDEQYFGEYMMNLRKDVACDLMVNRQKYALDLRSYDALLDVFMSCAYVILTRPIFNKEREGMNNTVKVTETMQSQSQKNGMFNIPFLGGGRK